MEDYPLEVMWWRYKVEEQARRKTKKSKSKSSRDSFRVLPAVDPLNNICWIGGGLFAA